MRDKLTPTVLVEVGGYNSGGPERDPRLGNWKVFVTVRLGTLAEVIAYHERIVASSPPVNGGRGRSRFSWVNLNCPEDKSYQSAQYEWADFPGAGFRELLETRLGLNPLEAVLVVNGLVEELEELLRTAEPIMASASLDLPLDSTEDDGRYQELLIWARMVEARLQAVVDRIEE